MEQAALFLGIDEEHTRQLIADKILPVFALTRKGDKNLKGYFSSPRDAYSSPTKFREFRSDCGKTWPARFNDCFLHIYDLEKIKEKLNESDLVARFLSNHNLNDSLSSFELDGKVFHVNEKLKNYLELFMSFLKEKKVEFKAKEVKERGCESLQNDDISRSYKQVPNLKLFVEKVIDRSGFWRIRLERLAESKDTN